MTLIQLYLSSECLVFVFSIIYQLPVRGAFGESKRTNIYMSNVYVYELNSNGMSTRFSMFFFFFVETQETFFFAFCLLFCVSLFLTIFSF